MEFLYSASPGPGPVVVDRMRDREPLHLTNRPDSPSPIPYEEDISVEMAWRFLQDRKYERSSFDLVANYLYDTDGILASWVLSDADADAFWRDLTREAAVAGAFAEYQSDDGVRLHFLIQGYRHSPFSPLASELSGMSRRKADELAHRRILKMFPRLFGLIHEYESIWWKPWTRVQEDLEAFRSGRVSIEQDNTLTVITGSRLLHPIAVNEACEGPFFLLATEENAGWTYRLDGPYHAWARTVHRPDILLPDICSAIQALSEADHDEAKWHEVRVQRDAKTSLLTGQSSQLSPEEVRTRIEPTLFASTISSHVG